MKRRTARIALAAAALAAVVAAVFVSHRLREAAAPRTDAVPDPVRRDAQTAEPRADDVQPGLPPASGGGHAAGVSVDGDAEDPLARAKDEPNPWASVDLEEVRAALPDNVYWKLSAPTKDPNVIREREEERERWNVEWGKVLSNTATEEEIAAYYAQRERLSSDYVQFATYLLTHYGKDLSQRDIGLLKVAVELHLARLEEIPRRMAEATERARAHEAARQAWLADQAKFEGRKP